MPQRRFHVEKQWVKQSQGDLLALPRGLRVINQQLWCCCPDAGIVVLDRELQLLHLLLCDGMGQVHDVAEMSNEDIAIAASNGLFLADLTGRLSTCDQHVVLLPGKIFKANISS